VAAAVIGPRDVAGAGAVELGGNTVTTGGAGAGEITPGRDVRGGRGGLVTDGVVSGAVGSAGVVSNGFGSGSLVSGGLTSASRGFVAGGRASTVGRDISGIARRPSFASGVASAARDRAGGATRGRSSTIGTGGVALAVGALAADATGLAADSGASCTGDHSQRIATTTIAPVAATPSVM